MTHAKPILALSSTGLGIAVVLLAVHLQRDRFAFTNRSVRNFEGPTSVTLVPPARPAEPVPPAASAEPEPALPTITIEALPVGPAKPRARKPEVPATVTDEPRLTPLPPCNPEWRELESGPAGRRVREICPPPSAEDVPRS